MFFYTFAPQMKKLSFTQRFYDQNFRLRSSAGRANDS